MFEHIYTHSALKNLGWSNSESASRELINIDENTLFKTQLNEFGLSNILLSICVTMYNEEEITPTIKAIYKNLKELEKIGIREENVLLIIISDGIDKVHDKVRNELLIDNNKNLINIPRRKDLEENIVYTCFIKYEEKNNFEEAQANIDKKKLNILFAIKEKNKGKLDSHFWFFWGFCRSINPEFIILIDAGTIVEEDALSKFVCPMMNDKQIGGVCGEMMINNNSSWFNFITNAQVFEYKWAHIVDKHLESFFGFITVLPGAFSGYRWSALRNSTIMSKYFMSLFPPSGHEIDCQTANMYLAEDRIFCHYLFNMKNHKYILKYLPDARASTDCPTTLDNFMNQRRRWINGTWFALWFVLNHCCEIWDSNHSILRKICFLILSFYFFISSLFTYFILANFYLALYFILLGETNEGKVEVVDMFRFSDTSRRSITFIYSAIVAFIVMTAMTLKPVPGKIVYIIYSILLGFIGMGIFGWSIYTLYQNFKNKPEQLIDINNYYFSLIFLGCVGVLNFILPLISNITTAFSVFFGSIIQYIFMQSTYSILLITYSFSNIDDVTWGNREALMTPEELSEKNKREQNFKCYKLTILIIWLILNSIYSWIFSYIIENHRAKFDLIRIFAYVVAIIIAFRLIFSILNKIKYKFIDKLCRKIYIFEGQYERDIISDNYENRKNNAYNIMIERKSNINDNSNNMNENINNQIDNNNMNENINNQIDNNNLKDDHRSSIEINKLEEIKLDVKDTNKNTEA